MSEANAVLSVDICVHATGPYLDYAKTLARSLDQFAFPESIVRMLVFTDRPDEVTWEESLRRITVVAIEVPSRGWPEATLLRFADYARLQSLITSDLVMFLDADMLAVDYFGSELAPHCWNHGVALVAHPGFYGSGNTSRRTTRRWLPFRRSSQRAIGSWEDNPLSRAHVPPSLRSIYVCGGVWFGLRSAALGVCLQLAERILDDQEDGVLAVWHDESHLNWWAAATGASILAPEYCYVIGYQHLAGLEPRIIAVDKPEEIVNRVKRSTPSLD